MQVKKVIQNAWAFLMLRLKNFDNSSMNGNTSSFKIPHMGWNNIYDLSSPLFNGVKENSFVYFVHSYYAELSPQTIATTDYIISL